MIDNVGWSCMDRCYVSDAIEVETGTYYVKMDAGPRDKIEEPSARNKEGKKW